MNGLPVVPDYGYIFFRPEECVLQLHETDVEHLTLLGKRAGGIESRDAPFPFFHRGQRGIRTRVSGLILIDSIAARRVYAVVSAPGIEPGYSGLQPDARPTQLSRRGASPWNRTRLANGTCFTDRSRSQPYD